MSAFKVEFKVDANRLGTVLAAIHGFVTDLDVSLIETVPHTKNVKRSSGNKLSAREVIMEGLQNAPDNTLTIEQGKQLLTQAGLGAKNLYGLRYTLVKKGAIQYRNKKLMLVK